MKKIIWISRDKDLCYDSSGKIYTISDVKDNPLLNVEVISVHNIERIRYKNGNTYRNNMQTYPIQTVCYNYGYTKKEIYVIFEDKGSANKLINKIFERYAKLRKLNLICHIIISGGNTLIVDKMTFDVPKDSNSLILYDADSPEYSITGILSVMKELKSENKRFVAFAPLCSEECALSFSGLMKDIKNIENNNLILLKAVNEYLFTGKEYIIYNPNTFTYELLGKPLQLGYKSNYIGKVVNSIERYLADRLADMTFHKPYYFNKSISHCWVNNCKSKMALCSLDEAKGIYNTNKYEVNQCRKIYLNKDKITWILKESLFGGIVDSLDILLDIKPNAYYLSKKLRDSIIKEG